MELVLSAIAVGGLVGASDQYLCLLIVSIAARAGWVQLADPMSFMSSIWFIAMVAMFWVLTVAPAFATLLGPGVMNVINHIINFLSGFMTPLSAAFLALASAGVIAGMNPELKQFLQTMKIFTAEGTIGTTGVVISGASAVVGASLTGMKALAKPAAGVATGTTGTVATPIFTLLENISSVVLMGGAYLLSKVDPWLLLVLLGVVFLIILGLLIYAVVQLMRLKRGIGRVLMLLQTYPRAGLAVCLEFFIWGSGWMIWKVWGRGIIMLLLWLVVVVSFPAALAATAVLPPVAVALVLFAVIIYCGIGLTTSRALLKTLEKEIPPAREAVQAA